MAAAAAPSTVWAQDASSEVTQEARRLFDIGLVASREGRWADARDAFEQSLVVLPRPITLLNLAGAYAQTSQLLQSGDAYRRFLQQAEQGPEAKYQEIAAAALEVVDKRTPRIRLRVLGWKSDDTLRLDGELIADPQPEAELRVDPGEHRVSLERRGTVALESPVVVAVEGETVDLSLDARQAGSWPAMWGAGSAATAVGASSKPSPPAKEKRSLARSPVLWTIVGALVAGGIATGVYFAVRNNQSPSDLPEGSFPPGSIEVSLGR